MSDLSLSPDTQHNKARWMIWLILLSLIILLVWASFAKINQVTRAKATVIASARTQQVQAIEGGLLKQLLVKEGQKVEKGQLLAVLEEERAQVAVDDAAQRVAALKASLARLEAEVYHRPLRFDAQTQAYPEYVSNQTELYKRRRQAIESDIAALQQSLKLAKQELAMNEPLLRYGDIAQADIIRLRRQVADLQAEIASKQNKYLQDAQTELTKVQEELDAEQEKLKDRNKVLSEKRLLAPMAGLVKNIEMNTVGGVIRAGETFMEIVPSESDLIVEAKVSPADIAYVRVGQDASVKLDAYDYSIFGSLHGQVTYISPDTLFEKTAQGEQPYYRVQIKIAGAEFKKREQEIIVKAGMTASVDIKALERTVLSYLTKPITKTLAEGMKER
ncbi:HlyD family type I secretion periplasmic adaptor subunit [Acinetobacter sp. c1-l78]|uniref:HlyD family type I secretion periplasmic adaptor subunit n=1 Tax=Acinetobacter sp. c1-l78 TaxID=3342803 RepID=UPI0035B8F671